MDSDKQLFEIFETNPQWIFELTERPSLGPCQFVSLTVKAIERRCDGVLVPDDLRHPIWVTEFQMQFEKDIYNRIVIEMAMIQREHPERGVEGLIIFGSRQLDPMSEPWRQVISVAYLGDLLQQLSQKLPTHPLIAVFQPLVEPDRNLLESRAAEYYNHITANTPDPRQREKLLSVYMDWLIQRFAERGLQEIEIMLTGKLPHLRDTQAGKDLIAIGLEQGIEQGIEQGLEQGLEKGLEQGLEQGLEKGELIGTILTCQKVLGLPLTQRSELESQTQEVLRQKADQLQATVTNRLGTNKS